MPLEPGDESALDTHRLEERRWIDRPCERGELRSDFAQLGDRRRVGGDAATGVQVEQLTAGGGPRGADGDIERRVTAGAHDPDRAAVDLARSGLELANDRRRADLRRASDRRGR